MLYETETEEATYVALPDSTYEVTIKAKTGKVIASPTGEEEPLEQPSYLPVAVFGTEEVDGKDKEVTLFYEMRKFDMPTAEVKVVVKQKPTRAGIDPYAMYPDKAVSNNVVKVKEAETEE